MPPDQYRRCLRFHDRRVAELILHPAQIGFFFFHRARIADPAAKRRLPTMHGVRRYVDAGGLIFYWANQADLYRRDASYVDRILKGAKPGHLPIEQPTRFELVINLKTAKALGPDDPADAFAAGGPRDRVSGRDRGRKITHGDQQEGVKTKDLAIARSRRSAGYSPHCSASEGGEQGGERDAERTAVRQDRVTGDPGSHSGARATRPSQARFPLRYSRGTRRPRPK